MILLGNELDQLEKRNQKDHILYFVLYPRFVSCDHGMLVGDLGIFKQILAFTTTV